MRAECTSPALLEPFLIVSPLRWLVFWAGTVLVCVSVPCVTCWVGSHMFIETLYEQKKKEHNMCDDHNIWRLWREIKTCFTKNTHKTQSRNGDKTKVCKKKSFSMMSQSLICVTLMNWSLYWSVNMMMDSHDVTNNWTSRAS